VIRIFTVLVVAVVMFTGLGVIVPSVQAQEPDSFVYHPDGMRCIMARVDENEYQERGIPVPSRIRGILAKCKQQKINAQQKRSPRDPQNVLGFFR
jgi:hypothetical protein